VTSAPVNETSSPKGPSWSLQLLELVPFPGITGWLFNWIRTTLTSAKEAQPYLTPLENDALVADMVMQHLRTKRSEEISKTRNKRFLPLVWITAALHAFWNQTQTTVDENPIQNSTLGNESHTTMGSPVDQMMEWLTTPLLGNQTLLSAVAPQRNRPDLSPEPEADHEESWHRIYSSEEVDEDDDGTTIDYAYDAYILVIVFGLVFISILATWAMVSYGEIKNRPSVASPRNPPVLNPAFSVMTLDSAFSEIDSLEGWP